MLSILEDLEMSLKDLIKKIDWVSISSCSRGSRLNEDLMSVNYVKMNNKVVLPNYLRLRIGKNIVDKLNWKYGDKINAMLDPDDLLSMILVRSTNEGRLLTKESKSSIHAIQFLWKEKIPLPDLKGARTLQYEIYDKYIHFHLPTQ